MTTLPLSPKRTGRILAPLPKESKGVCGIAQGYLKARVKTHSGIKNKN